MTVRSQTLMPKDWASKAPTYIDEAKQLDVEILPPDINKSELGFNIKNDKVYFGFNAIREVGKVAAKSLIKSRGKNNFNDIIDFLSKVDRTKITRKTYSALIKAGCFDSMGYSRKDLLNTVDEYYDKFNDFIAYYERKTEIEKEILLLEKNNKLIERRDILRDKLKQSQKKKNPGEKLTTQEEIELNELEDQKLKRKQPLKEFEKPEHFSEIKRHKILSISLQELIEQASYIGCYLKQHPSKIIFPDTDPITESEKGNMVLVSGTINSIKNIVTKKGQPMAFIELSDESGIAELIVFPKTYSALKQKNVLAEVDNIVKVYGKCEHTDPKIKIIVERMQIYKDTNANN